jgi:hypothetical protein
MNGNEARVEDEKLEDTLLDMICYGVIVLSLYKSQIALHNNQNTEE